MPHHNRPALTLNLVGYDNTGKVTIDRPNG